MFVQRDVRLSSGEIDPDEENVEEIGRETRQGKHCLSREKVAEIS